MKNTLGSKIKFFRNRAGISQMDLEITIGIASGSLSRIESDQINPTKETLHKIIDALGLKPYESSTLFDFDSTVDIVNVIELSRDLGMSIDINEILQNSADKISKELGLLGMGIFLVKNDVLYSHTFTRTSYSKMVVDLIRVPLNSFDISLHSEVDNIVLKCIKLKTPIYTESLSQVMEGFSHPKGFNLKVWSVAQKLIGLKSIILYPVFHEDTLIGAIAFAKDHIDDFELEKNVLGAFCDHIAVVCANALRYSKLIDELNGLRNK